MANSNISLNMQALTNELNKLLDDDECYAQNTEQVQTNYYHYSQMLNDQRFTPVQPFLPGNFQYYNIADMTALAKKDSSHLALQHNFITHSLTRNDYHFVMKQAASLQFTQPPEIIRPVTYQQSNNFAYTKRYSDAKHRTGTSKVYNKRMGKSHHRSNHFQSSRWDFKKQDKLQFDARTMDVKICLDSIRIGSKFQNGNPSLEILRQLRQLYNQVVNLSLEKYEVLAYISKSAISYGKLPPLSTRKIASNIEQAYRALLCENDSIASFLHAQRSLYDDDLWINVKILLVKFNDNMKGFEAFRNCSPNILWKMYAHFGTLLTSLTETVRSLSQSFFILKQRIREIPSPKPYRPRQRSVFIG